MAYSFFLSTVYPFASAIFRGKNLVHELKEFDEGEKTTTEKVDYVIRCLAVVASLGEVGCETFTRLQEGKNLAEKVGNLSEKAKKITLYMRIAAAATAITSSGSSLLVKLEKGTASWDEVVQLLAITIFESGRTAVKADQLYENFAKDCMKEAPFLLPKGLRNKLYAEGVDTEMIQQEMRKAFQDLAKKATKVGIATFPTYKVGKYASACFSGPGHRLGREGDPDATAPSPPERDHISEHLLRASGMNSGRSRQTILPSGEIVNHTARSHPTEQQDFDTKKRELAQYAAKLNIELFCFERFLKRKFEKPDLIKFICPITQAPINEPVFVKKTGRLFEKTALKNRLDENPKGFMLLIGGEMMTIHPGDSIEERRQDAKELQDAKEKALNELIAHFKHEARYATDVQK